MNLKDILIEAYEAQQREIAAHEAYYIDKCEQAILRWLKDHDITNAAVAGKTVITNDLVLQAEFSVNRICGWHVQGNCPKCGESVWSINTYDAHNLVALGDSIVNFRPDFDHHCNTEAGPAQTQTWQEKMAEAIAEAIKEL